MMKGLKWDMITPANYMARFYEELNHDINKMNERNLRQPVRSRQMTEEEKEKIFGSDPNYIKDIKVEAEDNE